ncbi:MAG: hypothetical protein JJLCMIEE_03542 [Acidimicrobiales bacterium]|nr:MAG: hypothetical protein EDR02_13420 [Actinomycetota bacterium]MBV6510402.1 hypothetical protein [Acidimicrobiales bacterium]RIK02598.1 MAG: hypothetical protein DCC48_17995 [Acidobacteriota bacterium]
MPAVPGSLPAEADEGGKPPKWPYLVAAAAFVVLGALGAFLLAVRDGEVATTASSTTAGPSSAAGPAPAPDSQWIYPWTSQAQLDRVMAGSTPEYCDAGNVAAAFVRDVIGYGEPDLGDPIETEKGTTEFSLQARGEGGAVTEQATTIVTDQIPLEGGECDPFVVTAATSEVVTVNSAAYDAGQYVVKVEGEGTAPEGTIEARLVKLDDGAGYEVLADGSATAGAYGEVQQFGPLEIPVEAAVDVALVVANPQATADGAEPPFTVARVDIGSEGQPVGSDGAASSPEDPEGSSPGETIAPPEDAQASGLPAQANAALGDPVWGLYLTAVDESYAGYNAPELTEAVLDAHNLGYNANARNMACDTDAVGALGLDPTVSWLTVPLYFTSEADAQLVAGELDGYTGIAQVTVGCLD